jgi:phosphatidylinositol 3-kinase
MDKLLLRENLDLKLTTYSVLATGAEEGMIQFVPSKTLAGVMSEYGSLLGYMREGYPAGAGGGGMEGPTYGVKASVLDTFVRSCGTFAFGLPSGQERLEGQESDRTRLFVFIYQLAIAS